MRRPSALFALSLAAALVTAPIAALAQDDASPEPIPFEGGAFTIAQPEEYGEKTLTYEGRELAHNYALIFDQIAEVAGEKVAIFYVGDGGNACGPAALLIWKPEGGDVETLSVGADDCGAPPVAINQNAIYFVPYLMPGDSAPVKRWDPVNGMVLAGNLTYTADPGTGWKDVKPAYDTILDAFHNEAVYDAARMLLGDRLSDVTTSLLVGGGTETTPGGIVYARGCVPHACGGSDGFMAIDAAHEKLYFAMEGDRPKPDAWPALDGWPSELRAALKTALAQ